MGTLRFDLDNLVAAKGAGATDVDALIKSLEKLDYAFRCVLLIAERTPRKHHLLTRLQTAA